MYDFANSGYTTVVITAVFNAYFVAEVAGNAPWATFAWTCALAVSYVLIIVTAPLIGAYADAHAAKKKLLVATTIGCIGFTAALALVGKGDVGLAVSLIVLSNFFFGTGENLVAGFLPEIAAGEAMGRVSGWGWSLGYLGGLVSLGACLAYVSWAQSHGQSASEFVPVTMLITAALLPRRACRCSRSFASAAGPSLMRAESWRQSISRLKDTIRHASRYADLRRFLVCLVFYQAGIQAVIALAAIYAQQAMGFTTKDTIVLILVVNVTAAAGAFAFGQVQDRLGHVRTIVLTLMRLDRGGRARVARGRPGAFLGRGERGRCLPRLEPVGRPRPRRLSQPALAQRRVLRPVGPRREIVLGPRARSPTVS